MEGPTPVSALIHAATMVTAGVYLIARMHPLFEQAPDAALVGAIIGATTLFVAATIGLAVTDIKRVIAWSTMSQIGYMVMGVSLGAYVAGMFHFMTHAFFKALLFMGAGSVIGAMAGAQDMDKMGGFRARHAVHLRVHGHRRPRARRRAAVLGLLLQGRDPHVHRRRARTARTGSSPWSGYAAAFITAIYTFRLIFRVFHGDPVPEARELEEGHLHHAEQHVNPTDGEVEDTEVGFPGPEHYVAERETPMKIAMGLLAILASIAGLALLPYGVLVPLEHFLEPTFADSALVEEMHPSDSLTTLCLVIGAAAGLLGHPASPSRSGCAARGRRRA